MMCQIKREVTDADARHQGRVRPHHRVRLHHRLRQRYPLRTRAPTSSRDTLTMVSVRNYRAARLE